MHATRLSVVLVAFALAACGAEEPPAPTTGTVAGTVKDGAAAAVAGAAVTTEPATVTATTDAEGKYSLADIAAGTYKVVVAKAGFVTKERAGIAVTAGATVTLDFVLDPATGDATISVKDKGCGGAAIQGATLKRTGAADATSDAAGAVHLAGLAPGEYTVDVKAAAHLPASATFTVVAGETATANVELTCQSWVVAEAARTFMAGYASGTHVAGAKAVHDNLVDGNSDNDPMLISVRAAADYEKGHIPGAINIPWKTVADEASLAKLGAPVAGKTYLNYCYTGHTGAIASAVLGVLGYAKSANLKFGIVAWTKNADARTALGVEPDYSKNFATETEVRTAAADKTPPVIDFPEAATAAEVVKLAARAYLSNSTMQPTISAQALYDNLIDGNSDNDPFIISVRKPEHYALGHIPGAIQVNLADIAKEETLKKIPTNRDIVVYCYTGHTGGVATGILGTLGYHKVKNLKYGIAGWTQNTTVIGAPIWNATTDSNDFTITTGTNP